MVSPSEGPAVDRGLLARLRADVGDETLRRYADAYLGLLPGRLDLVGQAFAAGERAEALRVLTDVRIGATMLGAARFAARVRGLENKVRASSQPEVEARLELLRTSAEAMAAELRREARLTGPGSGANSSSGGGGSGPGSGFGGSRGGSGPDGDPPPGQPPADPPKR
jgi:hypothetical protein